MRIQKSSILATATLLGLSALSPATFAQNVPAPAFVITAADPEPAPAPDPKPDPVPDPKPVPEPDPKPVPEPVPAPDPEPAPVAPTAP